MKVIVKVKKRFLQLSILIKFTVCKFLSMFYNEKETKKMWIFSERGTDARDNAYIMYKYVKDKYPSINAKYIIDRNSSDLYKLQQYNKKDIIYYRTLKHYIYILKAKLLISTHIMGFAPEMNLFYRLDKFAFFHLRGKRVFLQHGITKDKMKFYTDIDLFIAGAKPEYEFLKKNYPQYLHSIKYTGFPRFDRLIDNYKNQILLMPTWRINLQYEKFENSEYFKKYNELINNTTLFKILEENNYRLIFYPHHEIQKHIHTFSSKSNNIIIANKEEYDVQKLLIESKILITDYSSVFFDFGYMKKNIIYYQFDETEYRKQHYEQGYFDYYRDGFGPVFKDEKSVVFEIKNIINKEFDISKKYLNNINSFFEFNDHENSCREMKELMKLNDK